MKNIFAISAVLLVALDVQAQPKKPVPVEELQRLQAINEALSQIDQLKALGEKMSTTKRYKCLGAFGHAGFCDCLVDKTPLGATFETYIAVTTQSKGEMKYSSLTSDEKAMVDTTLTARETCVAAVFR